MPSICPECDGTGCRWCRWTGEVQPEPDFTPPDPPSSAWASVAFRRWCFAESRAIFAGNGKLAALRRILADIPTFFC